MLDLPGVDIIWDLDKMPYSWAENEEFDEIHMNNVLEHLADVPGVMRELYRILKPNGKLVIIVPFFSSRTAFTDITHKHFFGIRTLDFFCKKTYSHKCENFVDYFPDINFSMRQAKLSMVKFHGPRRTWFLKPIDYIVSLAPLVYERFFAYILPAKEIYFELTKTGDE